MKIFRIFSCYLTFSVLILFCQTAFPQYEAVQNSETLRVGSLKEDDEIMSDFQFSSENSPGVANSCLTVPVSVSFSNKKLIDGLQTIAKKAGIKLVYNDVLVNRDSITVNVTAEPLKKVLDLVLVKNGISYKEFKKGQIVLWKNRNAAERIGNIKGVVKDEKGELLYGANVVILETGAGSATDMNGKYIIHNVKPGNYILKASYMGCEPLEKKISVGEGRTIEMNFILKISSFQIGGIEVVGKTDLLPTDVSTKTTISSSEIEHYQASSIKDVLDLVPGVQKSENPGIGKTGQVAIRGDDQDQLSALGTLVVIDGTPVSNNANLQFQTMHNSSTGTSNLGGGVDLRTIPADNIESIEIITGLPSVRYGDVTEGVINIKTKIGSQPHRLKIKNNPDTKEANLGGGFLLGTNGLSYNFNLARSERDLRKNGDEYTRVTGQTVYSTIALDNKLSMNHKINGQVIFDEEEPKGDVYQTKNYNRGFSLGYSDWGKYTSENGVSSFEYNAFMNFRNINSMKSKLVSGLRIMPNGDTSSAYIGKIENKGHEWNLGGRLEWNTVLFTGDVVHKLLYGTDVQYNANTGEGVMIDSLYNYYGIDSKVRSYTFKDIPGQTLLSFYAEDKMTWHLLYDFNLMLGARYELYRPYQFNIKGLLGDGDLVKSHQGSFFNPRLNLMVYFSRVNQLRISAGTTSKSPAMSTIYDQPEILTWRNPVENRNEYFIHDLKVPDLKGYKELQFEVAYDHKYFDMIGTTVSAYYKERSNESESQSIPIFKTITSGDQTKVYYIGTYSLPENLGKTLSKGIEFAVKTNKIKSLNMNFEVTGAYSFSNSSRRGVLYDFSPDLTKGQYPNYKAAGTPVDTLIAFTYSPSGSWRDRLQLNYYIRYTLPPLGLWVTLRAEHLVAERNQTVNMEYEDPSLLITPEQKESYNFSREIKRKSPKWLFNINISKSLFKGAEVSFYVNNFLDDPGIRQYYSSPTTLMEETRNPPLFYGIEFSCSIDELFKRSER
ncbi:MAG: TonB-dependent receptor [Ignavibacteriales bacterium]